jgi:uncharacterized protein (DUF1499 family)
MKMIFLIFLVIVIVLGWGVWRNKHPRAIGVHEGKLSPCPSTPNCVCSYCKDPVHAIEPFPMVKEPIEKLAGIVDRLPRTKIIKKNDDYLYVEFRSKTFRFVDDVEFKVEESENLVHIRSASRVGYGDWGVNRDRMEMIRCLYL